MLLSPSQMLDAVLASKSDDELTEWIQALEIDLETMVAETKALIERLSAERDARLAAPKVEEPES